MIGLVACCKTKLDRPAPARELYISQLFRVSLRYAEAQCEVVYVASAKHGLVELDDVIAPYEFSLFQMSQRERELWGVAVARTLVARHSAGLVLVALAGVTYVQPIRNAFASLGIGAVLEPLKGMQLGQRLSWLGAQASREVRA